MSKFWTENAGEISEVLQRIGGILRKVETPSENVAGILDIVERVSSPSSVLLLGDCIRRGDPAAISALVPPDAKGAKVIRKISSAVALLSLQR